MRLCTLWDRFVYLHTVTTTCTHIPLLCMQAAGHSGYPRHPHTDPEAGGAHQDPSSPGHPHEGGKITVVNTPPSQFISYKFLYTIFNPPTVCVHGN